MEGVTRSNRYCIMRTEQAAQAHSLFQLLDVNPVRSTCCSFRKRRIYGGFGPFRVRVFLPDWRAKLLENSGNVHVCRSSDNLESRLPLSSLPQILVSLCMSGINKVSDTRESKTGELAPPETHGRNMFRFAAIYRIISSPELQ